MSQRTMDELCEELLAKRESARARRRREGGCQAEGERQTDRQERIELLLDPGTFNEVDEFVHHRCVHFGLDKTVFEGDRSSRGWGLVEGGAQGIRLQPGLHRPGRLSGQCTPRRSARSRIWRSVPAAR